MDVEQKHIKQRDQFFINVNNIVRELLKNDILFTNGSATKEAIRLIMNSLGRSQRQATRYLKAAREEILKVSKADTKEALQQELRDRHFLILQSKKDGDYKLALESMKDRAKLRGLYIDTTKGEMTIKNVDMSKFTEFGLERLKRGDTIEDVLMDPKAVKAE